MRMNLKAALLIILLFMVSTNNKILANTLPADKPPIFTNFCEGAETPADKQDCTKKRFQNAEDLLQKQFSLFQRFLQNTPHLENIKEVQNSWIQYRNNECSFESGFFEEEITRRTLELTCLSRLTEERALTLYNFIPRTRDQNLKNNQDEE